MVNGVPAEVLDASGRLIVTPHPVTLEGQRNIPAELYPGESLLAFLERHVPDLHRSGWQVSISGRVVPRAMWRKTFPKDGQVISCRSTVHKTVLAIIAIAVIAYFTMGAGLALYGLAAGGAAYVAGAVIIQKVLQPKLPGSSSSSSTQPYSLNSQRNTPRTYEPIGVLLGQMRVTPDLASNPYTNFESNDQYLSTILLGGINVDSYSDLSVGDTPISSYSDVTVYTNGFSGMASVAVPMYGNADSIAGGTLEDTFDWVTRTTSVDTVQFQVDIEATVYAQGSNGLESASVLIVGQYRPVGGTDWTNFVYENITNNTQEARRLTRSKAVTKGQYEVRMRRGEQAADSNITRTVQWDTLRSIQPDTTDYSGWGRIAIRIRATGQLSGNLDTLRATFNPRPLPVWNGSAWVNATTRAGGVSNPGAIILQVLRGIYDPHGVLQFGMGLSDDQIDIEGLKGFMLHCAAMNFTYDRWVTETIAIGDLLQEIALAGMGQYMWLDGSRPTVMWAADDQPLGGVVNMATMTKGNFSVGYQLTNAADGIEYQYVDRDQGFDTLTIRVAAPGVTTILNPARITGVGVTTQAHAAVMARYHLGQSLYQYKEIGFGADIEHLDYRRLSMLSLSHDMTQWGFGGRLVDAQIISGNIVLTLDEPIPPLSSRFMGLRIPGELNYRVFNVFEFGAETDTITLVGGWPDGVAFPGATSANPAHDTLWCYDVKATPGYRVRVVSITPEADLKGAKVTAVPEGPEFWDYVFNGAYVPAPSGTIKIDLVAANAKALQTNLDLSTPARANVYVSFDITGEYDHAQIWAALDGQPLQMVGSTLTRDFRDWWTTDEGTFNVEVRPFSALGRAGTVASTTVAVSMTPPPLTAPTGLGSSLEPFGIRLYCAQNPEQTVVGYQRRVGATWESAQVLESLGGTSYLWAVQTSGTFKVWTAAVDRYGIVGPPDSMNVAVPNPTVNGVSAAIVKTDLQLDYTATAGAFALDSYEIRYGDDYATSTLVGLYQVTRHVRRVDWGGARRWWVTAIDVKGNRSAAYPVDVYVTLPGAVTSPRSEVVDNNALLYWSPPATGSLPVDRYEVRKGASYAAGTVVGSNGNSTFAAIFEQQSGVYTYWAVAIDSAGNIGTPVGIPATINQPPDYILRTNIDSTFTGTLTSMYGEGGALLGPRNTTETWAQHFTSNGWSSPQDQINAGYPIYAEPSTTSGSYDESFDYGSVLAATTVTATLGYTVIAGTMNVSCQIYYKTATGDPWTAAAAGATSVLATNFRYVRVVWTFTCTAGANLIKVTSFNLKLASKLKTDSGAGAVTTASTGVVVPFNVAFIDADTPLVQPNGTTPLIPVVDFSDVANPTGFTVYLYTMAGAKTTGSFSWTARGY